MSENIKKVQKDFVFFIKEEAKKLGMTEEYVYSIVKNSWGYFGSEGLEDME